MTNVRIKVTPAARIKMGVAPGAEGPPGEKGDTGNAATIQVGTTTTLPPGSNATVTNAGSSSAAVLNFGIPEGEKGDQGDPGAAATIQVGTVTTVGPDDPATVTNVGTSSEAVFDFEIPQGEPGQDGAGTGDMQASVYDPQNIADDAFDRANHTGTQSAATITGLATVATTGAYSDLSGAPSLADVATSGDYDDLSNLPTLGTAAAADTGDFATAAQGSLADTAVQPADIADMLETSDIGVSVQGYDAATAKMDVEGQTLTGGAEVTSKDLGTQSTGTLTLDMGDRPFQHYTNNGAHTLAPGSAMGSCLLDITNGASAGAITTSGWTKVSGASFTTDENDVFRCHCSVGPGGSLLVVEAMQ